MKEVSESFLFDDLFGESIDETAHSMRMYDQVYDLAKVEHTQAVSEEFFAYVKSKKFFVIVAIYDSDKRFLLLRSVEGDFGWSLPGGSVRDDETVFDAVRRVAASTLPSVVLGELEPVAKVHNQFSCGEEVFSHEGLVFLARARKFDPIDANATCKFVTVTEEELGHVSRFANKQALKVSCKRVNGFEVEIQENEIQANENASIQYLIHRVLTKNTILTKKRKRKRDQIKIIRDTIKEKRRIIDVSCGDSAWPNTIVNLSEKIDVLFANDISWSQVNQSQLANPRVKFSNHDAIQLPFKEKVFDLAICMNTLHHMPSRRHLVELLRSMDRVSKNLFFWEIMDPKKDKWFPRWLNRWYYEWFLKDQGVAYLSTDQFQELLQSAFPDRQMTFHQFKNIQGTYNYATVEE